MSIGISFGKVDSPATNLKEIEMKLSKRPQFKPGGWTAPRDKMGRMFTRITFWGCEFAEYGPDGRELIKVAYRDNGVTEVIPALVTKGGSYILNPQCTRKPDWFHLPRDTKAIDFLGDRWGEPKTLAQLEAEFDARQQGASHAE